MAAPVYVDSGSVSISGTTNGSKTAACPATVAAGNFLLFHASVLATPGDGPGATFSTPSGWTALLGTGYGTGDARHALFVKIADGSEDGATITTTVATAPEGFSIFMGQIHRFSHADGFDSNSVEDVSSSEGDDNSHEPPTLTPGGTDRLAVLADAWGRNLVTAMEIDGESGGTWAVSAHANTTTDADGTLTLYTADQSGGGEISGGAASTGGTAEDWVMSGFLLKPAASGNQTATPSPVTVPIAIPTPTVALTYTASPDPVTVPLVVPAPTILQTYIVTPDAVTIPLVIVAPSLTAGAVTFTPDPVAVTLVLPDPVAVFGHFVTPDPVTIPIAIGAPTVTLTYSAAPDPVTVPLALATPTLSIDGSVTPDPVVVTIVITVPTASGDVDIYVPSRFVRYIGKLIHRFFPSIPENWWRELPGG